MSLGRVARRWSTLLMLLVTSGVIMTLATATRHHHRHRSLSYFHDSYPEHTHKLHNNISRVHDDSRVINYHQHQHHHHHHHQQQQQQQQQQNGIGPLRVPHLRHHHVSHRGPYFEDSKGQEINSSENVAHLGDTALLDCRVVMLSGKTVTWIRQSPNRTLLTVGDQRFSADLRYAVKFKYPNNWRLEISPIQKEDRGSYICQVNTHPPRTLVTNVTILAPDIRIVDEANHELRDRYYKTGSVIELTCIAQPSRPSSKVPHPVWKKNGETLHDHVNVYHTNGTDSELLTRLRIEHARKSDSGEFSCTIGQFSTTVVNIHVLNGEKQAAVHDQWNESRSVSQESKAIRILSSLLMFLIIDQLHAIHLL